MFEDSKITEARFTNNDYIDIQVLYETEADGLVEVNIEKGSPESNKIKVANVTREQLKEIAETKMPLRKWHLN